MPNKVRVVRGGVVYWVDSAAPKRKKNRTIRAEGRHLRPDGSRPNRVYADNMPIHKEMAKLYPKWNELELKQVVSASLSTVSRDKDAVKAINDIFLDMFSLKRYGLAHYKTVDIQQVKRAFYKVYLEKNGPATQELRNSASSRRSKIAAMFLKRAPDGNGGIDVKRAREYVDIRIRLYKLNTNTFED